MNRFTALLVALAVIGGAALGYFAGVQRLGTSSPVQAAGDDKKAEAKAKEYKYGEVLPVPAPKRVPIEEMDYRKVKPPPRHEVKPPKGAPNVVIVLMDQACYGDPSAMGGPINTPTMEKLAKNGLTYTNFHVNALCSPSRVSLLTGRNSHQCSMAGVVDTATGFPGDTGVRPASCAT